MTKQEIFTKVKNHLLTQGKKSFNDRIAWALTCAYRGEDGAQCAIGCLIPDELYKSSMDAGGLGVTRLHERYPGLLETALGCEVDESLRLMLSALQDVHDVTPIGDWPSSLQHVARAYGLVY